MSLKKQAIKGAAWTSVGTIGTGLLNLSVTIILARLLTPYDFGLIELLVVFSSLSDIIVDGGFSQAIIKDNEADDKDLSSVFWINVAIALIIYIVLFCAAPFIARFYNAPIIEDLSRIVFLTIIFNSLSAVQNANLSRKLSFRPYALASIISIVISGSIAVYLAKHDFGVWALAVNLSAFSFFRMCILWGLSDWHPKCKFSSTTVQRYFSFSAHLLVQSLFDKIITNFESLVIGKLYTKQQLGYFSQGRRLDSYITQSVSGVVLKVVYPVLAKIQDNEHRLLEEYRIIVGIVMCCISPIMAIMFINSEYIMNVIFGPQWIAASPYLRLWSLCGWCQILYSIFINIFLVKGRSKELLRLSIFKHILRLSAIIILVRISIMHMMYGIVAVTALTGILYIFWGGRLIQYSILSVFNDIKGILISITTASMIACFITPLLTHNDGILAFTIMSFVTMSVYFGLLIFQKNEALKSIISIIRRK